MSVLRAFLLVAVRLSSRAKRGICFSFLAATACRTAPSSAPRPATISTGSSSALRTFVDSMADAPEFANAHWGILIVDPERGDTLYARNIGKLFMPASNMKIFTSAVGLTRLGPDYRYATTFAARGPVVNGTLNGDLVVTGRGDPSVSDHMLVDAMTPLRAIADSIAARGIRRISGRVAAGGNAFPGEVFGFGWSYDDFEDSYSAAIDDLLFNEGFSVLHVSAGTSAGQPVKVETRPARRYPRVRVLARTVAASTDTAERRKANTLRARKDSLTWDVIVDGDIPARDSMVIEVTHHDPRTAYLAAVREALHDRGITVDDEATDTLAKQERLATLSSPPLSEILKALMKPSQNQIAEMLFRSTALEVTGVGRADSARAVVERQIAQWGIPLTEAVIRDGSGLSRYDYISPRAAVHVLDAMRRSPHFRAYYDAMPIAGVDGTIRNRMKGTPAEGNVHAKTGSVAMARSLSGYVTTANGRMLIFSFLANNWTVNIRAVERVQDAIAVRLAGMDVR
jgi:D-alanyl-D-alanine carboxypeptidase/D-alanyl-D-alanine-endopeptidase (penicillin-binding protein 4)